VKRISCLILALSVLATLAGCAAGPEQKLTQREITAWPENEFTAQVFPPEAGMPSYTVTDGDGSFFCVCYEGITREEGEEYLERLYEAGYTVTERADEDNVLLERAGTNLSVSCGEGALVIYISFS